MKPILILLFLVFGITFVTCVSDAPDSSRGRGGKVYYEEKELSKEEKDLVKEEEKEKKKDERDNISAVHEGPDADDPYVERPVKKEWKMPYRLDRPTAKFKLPKTLEEISGLGITSGGKRILAINDEKGLIYFLDIETGELDEKIKFGKKGDYEGIEMVGDDIFVVKSNGDIYTVENVGTENQRTETFKTHLNSDNDVEGLGYDEKKHRLLLACKRYPGKGYEGQRAIYAFRLMAEDMPKEPAFLIHDDDISNYFKMEGVDQRLLEIFTPNASAKDFQPSALAVHPLSGDLYILSSVGKLLMVMNQDGDIRHLEKLDKAIFRQPEGICFENDGTMYISTEGKGRRGRIFRFPMKGW